MKHTQTEDLRAYRTFGFPLLGFLAIVGLAGIALTVLVHLFA